MTIRWRHLLIAWLMSGAVSAVQATDRAIWVWEAQSYAMLDQPEVARQTIELAQRKHLNYFYLYADAYAGKNKIVDTPQAYRTVVRQLHAAGMHVYALLGSMYLHTEGDILPERRAEALAMFGRVLAYNDAASDASERFDGINLDIEPYLLDSWERDRQRLLPLYLDLAEALMRAKRVSGSSIPVGPAIPFWFAGTPVTWHGVTASLTEHALGLYDYAALMDYRDHAQGADGMIGLAQDSMVIADRLDKKLVIGVEVGAGELQKVSFHHLKESDLETALQQTEQAYSGHPSFAGFAIDHYQAYVQWLNEQAPGVGADAIDGHK